MTYTCIDYTVESAIATVTLDRPESLNALTLTMARELVQVMDVIDADDDVRAVVFTGRGRAYCAGADLSAGTGIFERESTSDFQMARDADWGGTVSRRFFDSTKPPSGFTPAASSRPPKRWQPAWSAVCTRLRSFSRPPTHSPGSSPSRAHRWQ